MQSEADAGSRRRASRLPWAAHRRVRSRGRCAAAAPTEGARGEARSPRSRRPPAWSSAGAHVEPVWTNGQGKRASAVRDEFLKFSEPQAPHLRK